MKKLLLLTSLVLSTAVMATSTASSQPNITIETIEVTQEQLIEMGMAAPSSNKGLDNGGFAGGGEPDPGPGPGPGYGAGGDRIEQAGRIITVARDMVALGEAIYELVRKGKPSNVTEYAPISVVPRDPMTKEYVDPFDLEGFSMPVEKNFVANIKSGGREVVKFAYKVMYSYGGSFNGAGKYLTSVIVVPSSVVTKWGWEFNASMKLSGIMNHGSRVDPVAGVMVTMKYQMNGWGTAYERNDTIHITGAGQLKNHMMP